MQEDYHSVVHEEQGSCDSGGQPRTDFPETISEGIHERQTQWPAILHCFYITADLLAFAFRQRLQPLTHRLVASGGAVESAVAGAAVTLFYSASKKIHCQAALGSKCMHRNGLVDEMGGEKLHTILFVRRQNEQVLIDGMIQLGDTAF